MWRGGKCAATLTGHEGPVLCLLVLPGGEILSGSGDTTVKMWAPGGGPCIHTIKAHTDTVRCGTEAGGRRAAGRGSLVFLETEQRLDGLDWQCGCVAGGGCCCMLLEQRVLQVPSEDT